MDLAQLLKKSQSSKVLSSLAADVFKRKFASKLITFKDSAETSMIENNSSVLIYDYKTFTTAVQKFGHLMTKIQINYDDIEVDQHKEISALLIKYCSNSLISLEIIQWENNALKTFKNSFKKVQNLTIHGDIKLKSSLFNVFSEKKLKLNEIFPALRQLNLYHMFVSNPSVLNVEFPYLEHVNIVFFPAPFNEPFVDYFSKTKPAIKYLFDKNPYIQYLSLTNCNSLDYLNIASDLLPNLRQMYVHLVSLKEHNNNLMLDFPSVRKLELKMTKNVDFFKIAKFEKLKDLNLICGEYKCKSLPLEHFALSSLRVSGFPLVYGNLLEFNEKTPNLEELFIASESKIDANTIIEYLKENLSLKKLNIVSHDKVLFDVLSKWVQGWTLVQDNCLITLEKQK